MEPQPTPRPSWFLTRNGLTVLVAIPIQAAFLGFLIVELDRPFAQSQAHLLPLFLFHLFPGMVILGTLQAAGFPVSSAPGLISMAVAFLGGIPMSLLCARILCIFFRPFVRPTGKPLVRAARLVPGLILLWFLSIWGLALFQTFNPSKKQLAVRDIRGFQSLIQYHLLTRRPLPTGEPIEQLRTLLEFNQHRHGRHLKIDASRWTGNGLYLDPWGSPYAFGWWDAPFQRTRAWAYSFGPNQIDEGGRGDDIASWH